MATTTEGMEKRRSSRIVQYHTDSTRRNSGICNEKGHISFSTPDTRHGMGRYGEMVYVHDYNVVYVNFEGTVTDEI